MLAERVVFVEKGTVRFDGPIGELTARDEFARAIFLGGPTVITVHGWDISQQMLLSGVVQGLAYAALGAGIVLVYRASGVINFAVAAFGTTAVAFMAVLLGGGIAGWHAPFWVAFVLATVAAACVGALVDWAVIRRLADAPRLVLLVATIGIAQVLLLVALLLPDVIEGGFFTPLLDWTWTVSPELLLQGRETSVLVVDPRAGAGARGVPHPDPHRPHGARGGREPRQGAPRRHPGVPHVVASCGRSRPRSPPSPRSRWRRCGA